jgi:hypothetical protein
MLYNIKDSILCYVMVRPFGAIATIVSEGVLSLEEKCHAEILSEW